MYNAAAAATYYRDKNVTITGGLGMIGSNLARSLVDLGANVTIVDAMLAQFGGNHFNLSGYEDRIHLIAADIRDRSATDSFILNQHVIFNFAAQVSHNDSIRDPYSDAQINYLGHLNVLESARVNNPDVRIIYSGSRLQYGKVHSVPTSEDHPLNPETPYAFNKTVAESMYRYYYRLHGIDSVLFRITNPYGVRGQMKHSGYGIVNYFIGCAMRGEAISVFGDGSQIRDYIYISDLVDALVAAGASVAARGKVMNLGSGRGTSFREMAETVVRVVGRGSVSLVPWPKSYINVETGDFIANIDLARNTLGWTPEILLEDGVRITLHYYEQYGGHYFE